MSEHLAQRRVTTDVIVYVKHPAAAAIRRPHEFASLARVKCVRDLTVRSGAVEPEIEPV